MKKRLGKDDIHLNHEVLRRAVLLPEDVVFDPENRRYPQTADSLMKNPFKRENKKKKKKRLVRKIQKWQQPIDF